jgi:hypothetical protein
MSKFKAKGYAEMAISRFEKDPISTATTPMSDQNDPVIELNSLL